MSGSPRIPRTIDLFNTYITQTNTYLLLGTPTNWSRFGWLATEQAQWAAFGAQWAPLYLKYSDKKGGRTTAITDQLHAIIEQCFTLNKTKGLLDRIAAAPTVTITDLQMFHIKSGVLETPTHSVSKSPITDSVMVNFEPLGGGEIILKCRTQHGGSKPSIAPGADCVQYAYQVGGTAPESADATGLIRDLSTKSAFLLHSGLNNAGKTLYIFFRWNNTRHPDLAGPWGSLQTSIII